jgi:hypothetical protein
MYMYNIYEYISSAAYKLGAYARIVRSGVYIISTVMSEHKVARNS